MKPMLALGVVVCMSVAILGQERDRAKVPDRFKWNLADVYPSDAAWRAEKDKIAAAIEIFRDKERSPNSISVVSMVQRMAAITERPNLFPR